MMNFGAAIECLKTGNRVSRGDWPKRTWLELQVPDAHSKMGHPYIYVSDVNGVLCPWTPSHVDMMATDWIIVAPRQ